MWDRVHLPLVARLDVAPPVAAALADRQPVVALESSLISHGLPHPENLAVARDAEASVRENGATPATIAIRDGRIVVGMEDAALELLASVPPDLVRKVSRSTLAATLADTQARGGWGATTVSATMLAAHAAGIRVLATGGIGGVHLGAISAVPPSAATLDISSDLEELARTPLTVVCAGPKAILDVPATLEYLETRGVPVVTVGQDDVPGFYARSSGIRAAIRAEDLVGAAEIAALHLGLEMGGGVLVCIPVPQDAALPEDEASRVVQQAAADVLAAGVTGQAVTPWLLARVAALTGGRAALANRALIVNDAGAAARLATAMAGAASSDRA
jgi:pseudouridine-5'-phosphate glycosidase